MKSSDYQQGYADGFDDMQSTAFKETRLEAFAAIRRAAAVARLADAWDDHEMDLIADGARRAIRAAIGSEKV